jgi:uncharacterized membrane protein
VLGETNYQKIEVVHRFADAHPYVHPLLLGAVIVIVVGIVYFLALRFWRNK